MERGPGNSPRASDLLLILVGADGFEPPTFAL